MPGLVAKTATRLLLCGKRRFGSTAHLSSRGEGLKGRTEALEEGYEVTEVQRLEMSLEKTPGMVSAEEAVVKDNFKPESVPFMAS